MNKRVGGFGPPTTWEFTIRRPVAFDARPSLRAFLREGSGRKWIHVEPYWRGPADAPIVVRERKIT
jgi:hypothetical protein